MFLRRWAKESSLREAVSTQRMFPRQSSIKKKEKAIPFHLLLPPAWFSAYYYSHLTRTHNTHLQLLLDRQTDNQEDATTVFGKDRREALGRRQLPASALTREVHNRVETRPLLLGKSRPLSLFHNNLDRHTTDWSMSTSVFDQGHGGFRHRSQQQLPVSHKQWRQACLPRPPKVVVAA